MKGSGTMRCGNDHQLSKRLSPKGLSIAESSKPTRNPFWLTLKSLIDQIARSGIIASSKKEISKRL
jgi:hypothetical protein